MVIYRVLRPLSRGEKVIPAGKPTMLDWLNEAQREKLIQVGAVSELRAPPFEEFPGWKGKAKRLEKAGIRDVAEFLSSDNEVLAKALRCRLATVQKWKREIQAYLMIAGEERG